MNFAAAPTCKAAVLYRSPAFREPERGLAGVRRYLVGLEYTNAAVTCYFS